MALHYDLRDIIAREGEDFVWPKDESGEPHMNPLVHWAIWRTLGLDMGSITEENLKEFIERWNIWSMIFDEEILKEEDAKRLIGLKTNVTTTTRAKWDKRIALVLKDRVREFVAKKLKDEKMEEQLA